MSAISSIVNVSIAVQTQGITRQAYNQCMLLSSTKAFTEIYQLYADMTEIANVFSPTSPEYVCAQTFFSQEPTTTPLMIGRRPADSVTATITSVVDNEYSYTLTINDFANTVDGSTATGSGTITFVNTAAGATVVFPAAAVVNMNICGADLTYTATGVNNTDFTALEALIVSTGAANIGAVSFESTANTTVTYSIATQVTATNALTITDLEVLIGGVPWASDQAVATLETSPQVLAVLLSQAINANTNLTSLVTASASGSNVVVNSVTNESAGGLPWDISASTSITNTTATSATNNAYNLAYLQVVTRSTVGTYAAIINGTRYQYVSTEYTESFSDVSLGLYNAIIQGDPSGVTVTYNQQNELIEIISNNSNKFILNTFPAQRVFVIARMYLQDPIATGDIQEDLSNIYAARSFYALASTDRTVSNVLQCAQFALTNKLLFGTASSDPNIYSLSAGADSISIAALLNISGGDRSFVMYHQDAGNDAVGSYSDTYPEMAWFGRMLNTLPGAQNWALKRLAAIAPTSGLSTTQIQNIFNKNCNIFYRISGVAITRWGTLSSGAYLYIDVLRGADWLVSSIQESVYGALIEAGKIPYTDKGIEVIASTILQQLRIAEENGYLSSSPTPTVSVPNAIDIPPAEKEARVLNNVTFTATLAGAINTVNIAGTLTF